MLTFVIYDNKGTPIYISNDYFVENHSMILGSDSESITSILQKGTLLLYFLQAYWRLIRSNMSVKRGS